MYKIGEEELVLCPYNGHHVVSKLRIQKHIMKCKKNNPDVKLATCFYNYSHRLKPEDLLAHYEVCSHKTRIDGARYCEPSVRPSSASMKNDLPEQSFPDLNAKTRFFFNPPFSFSSLANKNYKGSQKLDTSVSYLNYEDTPSSASEKISFKPKFIPKEEKDEIEEGVSESELEQFDEENVEELLPLPLPKTLSKAFVCNKKTSYTASVSKPSSIKRCGRGKSLVAFSPPKESRPTDHLLPDLSDMDVSLPKRDLKSKFFLKNLSRSSSTSFASSMFDDSTTLKSEDVIFDEDIDKNDDCGFILKNFDKYTKIKN